jgi:uncharacterized protein (DUF427 family)
MALEKVFEEILAKRQTRSVTPYCAYQALYYSLGEADKKTLDDAWAKNYPVNLIVIALRTDGHKASSDTIRAHQNGTCRCPKN